MICFDCALEAGGKLEHPTTSQGMICPECGEYKNCVANHKFGLAEKENGR